MISIHPHPESDSHHQIVRLKAFGRVLGEIELSLETDHHEKLHQYILTYRPLSNDPEADINDHDPIIIEEGHKDGSLIQRIK